MAMTQGNAWLATDFVNLKARVKAEMNRRNGSTPLTAYAGAGYDYVEVPALGVLIKEEHYDKIRDTMTAINPAGVTPAAKAAGDLVMAMNALEANMTTFEAKPRGTTSGTDCASGCAGMCVTVCTTTCLGCSGCTDACSGCTGCSGCSGCGSGCATGCSSCSGCSGCGSGCAGGCSGTCTATCADVCNNGCAGCSSGCQGCIGSCVTGCLGGCYVTCSAKCASAAT